MTDYTRGQIEEMLAGTTPGPWQADGTSVFVDTRRQVCCGKGQYECCGEPDIEGDYGPIADAHPANARLITAAPDLARQCLAALDRVEALEGALEAMHHATCGETGFAECVRRDSGKAYPWPALDLADARARALIAKLEERG